jgi:hypothetical protein
VRSTARRVIFPRVEPIDSGVFAGELRPSEPVLARSARPPLIKQAIRTGAIAGALPGAIVFVAYFVSNHALPLPWVTLGTQVLCIATACGMVLAGAVQACVLGFDRIARIHPVLVAIANPIVAGALAGAVGGILPGAIGVSVLGSYHGPFLGTVPIACALIGGTTILIVPLTLRARRARHPKAKGDRWRVAAATGIATVIIVDVGFAWARPASPVGFGYIEPPVSKAMIGAFGGGIGGMVLGIYVGIAMAIGRRP